MIIFDLRSELRQIGARYNIPHEFLDEVGERLIAALIREAPVGDYHNDPYVYHGYASGPRMRESIRVEHGVRSADVVAVDYAEYIPMDVRVLRTLRANRWWRGFLMRYPEFERKTEGPPRTYLADDYIGRALHDTSILGVWADAASETIQRVYGGTRTRGGTSAAAPPDIPDYHIGIDRLRELIRERRMRRERGGD